MHGASVSFISESIWTKTLGARYLAPSNIRRSPRIWTTGWKLSVRVTYESQEKQLPLVVVSGRGSASWPQLARRVPAGLVKYLKGAN